MAKVARGQRNKTLLGATADVAKQGDVDDDMVEALETAVGSDELTESKGRGVPGVPRRYAAAREAQREAVSPLQPERLEIAVTE